MSKKRYIDTKFWSDGYIDDLDPTEKLLFLYLLTNERTNVAGVYELSLKIMSVETGIEKEMLDKILTRFVTDGKVVRHQKWIRMVNSDHHQNMENRNIQKGIENVLGRLPEAVKQGLKMTVEDSYKTLTRPSNNLDLDLDSDLDSNLDSDLDSIKADKPPTPIKKVDEVSKAYYETIKELELPVRNHSNLRSRIKALEKEVGREPALMYLRFVREHYPLLEDDGFKPRLAESLDIYAKRVALKGWIERKIIERNKPATAGGRPIV